MKNNTTNVMICNKKIIAQTIDNQDLKHVIMEHVYLIWFCQNQVIKFL